MADYIPTAPEWEAHFIDPDNKNSTLRFPVAFWECQEGTEVGTAVRGYCPSYGPNGKFIQRGDPNFLGFRFDSRWS